MWSCVSKRLLGIDSKRLRSENLEKFYLRAPRLENSLNVYGQTICLTLKKPYFQIFCGNQEFRMCDLTIKS
jgi:hypothetical protein